MISVTIWKRVAIDETGTSGLTKSSARRTKKICEHRSTDSQHLAEQSPPPPPGHRGGGKATEVVAALHHFLKRIRGLVLPPPSATFEPHNDDHEDVGLRGTQLSVSGETIYISFQASSEGAGFLF